MKCSKCGNEQGKARVSPFPVSFIDIKTKQSVQIFYMGGFIGDKCWFCQFSKPLNQSR